MFSEGKKVKFFNFKIQTNLVFMKLKNWDECINEIKN